MNSQTRQAGLATLKARRQAAWSAGDYAVIGTTLQIVGEELCEALDVRSGQKVLDVAAGNGNASVAAAHRWCDVVATDYVPSLLDRARERAAAERLDIQFREADAEALPFGSRAARTTSAPTTTRRAASAHGAEPVAAISSPITF